MTRPPAVAACLLLALSLLAPGGPLGEPARAVAKESWVLPKLPGTAWHTRDGQGALFFVLRGVGVRFGEDGTFVATVRFIDDQKTSRNGTYTFDGDGYLTLEIEGLAKQRVRCWTDGPDIVAYLKDTVRLGAGLDALDPDNPLLFAMGDGQDQVGRGFGRRRAVLRHRFRSAARVSAPPSRPAPA